LTGSNDFSGFRRVDRALRAGHIVVAVLALVVLAGCGSGSGNEDASDEPNVVRPGAPGEPTKTLTPDELKAIEPPSFARADVAFMQGMIHHHAQALRMTALVPSRTRSRQIRLLAERMELSQRTEIDQMEAWLRARKQSVPVLGALHEHHHPAGVALMPGMLRERELDRLGDATSTPFERLFLRDMIRHHRGALTMVRRLYAQGGGLEPDADAFARHVEADQAIEIARMQQLLAARS